MLHCPGCGIKIGFLSPQRKVESVTYCPNCAERVREEAAVAKASAEAEREAKRLAAEVAAAQKVEARRQAARVSRVRKAEEAKARVKADKITRLGPMVDQVKASPHDAMLRVAFADKLRSAKLPREAEEQYAVALALGIVDPGTSARTRWKYADLLWKRLEPRHFLELGTFVLKNQASKYGRTEVQQVMRRRADVFAQLKHAESEIKRQLRVDPDDTSALEFLIKVLKAQGKPTSDIEDQIRFAKVRRAALGEKSTPRTKDVTGRAFEEVCRTLMISMGLEAQLTSVSGDGGVDIIAINRQPLTSGTYVVQCKDWVNPVGEPAVRDLLGVVAAEDAVKGILITSGTFTPAARRFAEGRRLELIDGDDLRGLVARKP